jgi:hypothetical protein
MSQAIESVVEPIRQAVQKAHNTFLALQTVVGDRQAPMPMPLLFAGTALDKLLMTLDFVCNSTSDVNYALLYSVFDARVGTDIQLSHAILHDMKAVAERLSLMAPSNLAEPMMTPGDQDCQNIANVVDRYDRAISTILIHYNSCVRSFSMMHNVHARTHAT